MIPLTQLLIDNYSQSEIKVLRNDFFDSYKKSLLDWFYPFDLFVGGALKLVQNSESKSVIKLVEAHFPIQCSLIYKRIKSYPQIEKTVINNALKQGITVKKIQLVNQEFIDTRSPVVIINDNNDNSYFLKPHSTEPCIHYYQIAKILGISKPELSVSPNIISNCSEFLLEEEVRASRNIQISYSTLARQLGNTIALFQLLGTRDMHAENIRLSDSGLCILDSETIFQPSNHKFHDSNDSFRRTLLFENKKIKGGRELDYSGLRETIDMISSSYKEKELFVNEICDSYYECWMKILLKKSSLIDYCNSKMSNLRVRCILGATSAYYSIIYKEVLCSVSSENQLRLRVENKLQKIKGHKQSILLSEYIVNCLVEGQIPAFFNYANSRCLNLGSGDRIEKFFLKSVSGSIIGRCKSISSNLIKIETSRLKSLLLSQMKL